MNSLAIKESIRKKYNDEVALYDKIFETPGGKHFIRKKLKKAETFGYFEKGQEVLEIGSATGVFSFEFEKYGFQLTAIDLSNENIMWASNKAKNTGSNIKFQVADVESLPFPDNSFDGIISFSTLRYVPDIYKALEEIRRVVKPGGYILLDFPNKKCPWFGGLKKKVLGREHIFDNHYYLEDIEELLTKSGFKEVIMKRGLFIPKSVPSKLFQFFKAFECIAEKLPVLSTYSAIIFAGARK